MRQLLLTVPGGLSLVNSALIALRQFGTHNREVARELLGVLAPLIVMMQHRHVLDAVCDVVPHRTFSKVEHAARSLSIFECQVQIEALGTILANSTDPRVALSGVVLLAHREGLPLEIVLGKDHCVRL